MRGRTPVRASRRGWRLAWVTLVAVMGAGGLGASAARAATLTVTTAGDPPGNSQCSLREAILTVDTFGVRSVCGIADESGNTIVLGPQPYTLSLGPSGGDDNSTGDLDLTASIPTTIEGAGVGQTTITGVGFPAKNPDRLFHVIAGTVTIRDLTLADGTAPDGANGTDGVNGLNPVPPTDGGSGFNGGAIFNGGTLALIDVIVTNNHAGNGGKGGVGVTLGTGANGGHGGAGGGIYNVGALSLTDVTFSGNHAGTGGLGGAGGDGGAGGMGGMGGCCGDGGGLDSAAGTVTITGTTFTQNHAGDGGSGGHGGASADGEMGTSGSGGTGAGGSSGGAVAVTGGSATITNSTLTANVSGRGGDGGNAPPGGHSGVGNGGNSGNGSAGGGLFVSDGAMVTLLNVTVAENQVGPAGLPGLALSGGSPGTAGNPPFGGGVYTNGAPGTKMTDTLLAGNQLGNCAGPVTGSRNLSFGDTSCPAAFISGDPILGALWDNGGPTQTQALGAGSAAIDRGAACAATDQRGITRPAAACDIGAYEFTAPAVSTGAPSAVTLTTADLNGTVSANNSSAAVVFEFGTTTAYGSQAPALPVTGLQPEPVTAQLTGLTPGTTYHYRLVATSSDASAASADATFTTASPPSGTTASPPSGTMVTAAAELTHASIAPSRFFAAPSKRHKTGTTITYTDSVAATTTIVVFAQTAGVKVHGRCVKPRGRGHGRPCIRLVKVGSFSHADHLGRNAVRFSGRLGGHKLPPGRYVLELTPTFGGQEARTVLLRCRVI